MKQICSICAELETGSEKASGSSDHSPGLLIFRKIGEKVEKGETLAEVHFNQVKSVSWLKKQSQKVFSFSEKPPDFQPLIIERI
jgi:pyrimidine-nucleoside phosphorylase